MADDPTDPLAGAVPAAVRDLLARALAAGRARDEALREATDLLIAMRPSLPVPLAREMAAAAAASVPLPPRPHPPGALLRALLDPARPGTAGPPPG